MPQVTPFVFEDQPVRTIQRDGEPWFVAIDVCSCLELTNSRKAIAALDADEKGVTSSYTPGGEQEVTIISEPGLYTLILRSRKATRPGTVQHRFRRWVTSEVLPAIRRVGRYEVSDSGAAASATHLKCRYTELYVRMGSGGVSGPFLFIG